MKTGLLAGEALWELARAEQVRRCAAFKAAVCLRDPHERGERAHLNLGHTFAHALEAASDYTSAHGHAVALGLTAALRLSDLDDAARPSRRCSHPSALASTLTRMGRASARQEGDRTGASASCSSSAPGEPYVTSDVEPERVRAALGALIA